MSNKNDLQHSMTDEQLEEYVDMLHDRIGIPKRYIFNRLGDYTNFLGGEAISEMRNYRSLVIHQGFNEIGIGACFATIREFFLSSNLPAVVCTLSELSLALGYDSFYEETLSHELHKKINRLRYTLSEIDEYDGLLLVTDFHGHPEAFTQRERYVVGSFIRNCLLNGKNLMLFSDDSVEYLNDFWGEKLISFLERNLNIIQTKA